MNLLYGKNDPRMFDPYFCEHGYIYNFTTMKEGYESLQTLIPPNQIGHLDGYEFDVTYMKYIMSNDYVFMWFFRIIYNLYIGKDVFLLSSEDDWSENLIESLLKLVQQRYGINGINIVTDEDYIDASVHSIVEFAPGYGLYNLDIDKDRFLNLIELFIGKYNQLPFFIEGYFVGDE